MEFCHLVLRKKRNILALAVTLWTSLFLGYYIARYENVCDSSTTRTVIGSHSYYKDHSEEVVRALDRGCYLQASNFTQHQHSEELLAKRNCMQKIPTALIVGAALSGSATLKSALSFHPDVVVPEFVVSFRDNDQYLDMMPYSLPDQITIGECQEFMYMRDLSRQMLEVFPSDLKIIILIRDPVARAMSEYLVLASNSSSQFYLRSLSQYAEVLLNKHKQEIHTKVKRNVNTRSNQDRDHQRSRRKLKHKEKNKRHRDKRAALSKMGRENNFLLHDVGPSEIRYNLEDTFQETVLKSPSEIDEVQFLVQRSIYGNGIKQWAKVIPTPNILILDAERFAKNPADIMDIVERFLGLRPFFQQDFFDFDLPNGVLCFNSRVRSCVEPILIQKPPPSISEEVVALLREFFLRSMKVQNRYSGTYFPHLGENPLIYTPFR